MSTIALGLVALVALLVGAVVLLLPAQPGWPPGWVIVLVLFGVPILGILARQVLVGGRDDDD